MTINITFIKNGQILFSFLRNRYLLISSFLLFFVINYFALINKRVILNIEKFQVKKNNKITTPALFLLKETHTIDSLPNPKKQIHFLHNLNRVKRYPPHKNHIKRFTQFKYPINGKAHQPVSIIYNKIKTVAADSLQQLKLSLNLPVASGTNKLVTDNISKAFLQFINQYFYFNNLTTFLNKLDSASVSGQINIAGVSDSILDINDSLYTYWNGILKIDSTRFKIVSSGTSYTIDSEIIAINYPKIFLNNFIVKDAAHNKLEATGQIVAKPQNNAELNIAINTNNFTILDVQKAIANQLYGFVSIDANAIIKGTIAKPIMKGNIELNDKTAITLILPNNNANKQAEQSMIRFIDKDVFNLPPKMNVAKISPIINPFQNNFTLEVPSKAALTFIIDPSSGDILTLHGKAKLKAGNDSATGVVLSGIYNLDSGYYRLNYQFLQKQFNILPGSSISFNGAPADAQLNIKAVYIVNTIAQDLLENEVGQINNSIAQSFKVMLPFSVLLKLTGPVKNPAISFEVEMPDSNTIINNYLRVAIKNKLAQIKENISSVNKQVFSLLLYGRFVGEQSTDFFKRSGTGDGGRFDDLAHESVSKFLSSALDNIATDLFKTLDVSHDLDNYKDYGNGDAQQKSEIQMEKTKGFIDDRLRINVGKDYGIDGQDASAKAAQQKGVGFLPDVTLNYKLTKDGKYRYRSYKKNQFEVTIDGYVIETGISFILIFDYDQLSDLLNKYK